MSASKKRWLIILNTSKIRLFFATATFLFESNFCKYFLKNFNLLELKRLIYLSYGMTQRGFDFNSIDELEEYLDRFEIKN